MNDLSKIVITCPKCEAMMTLLINKNSEAWNFVLDHCKVSCFECNFIFTVKENFISTIINEKSPENKNKYFESE